EAYDQAMANKTMDFFKKRQANEPSLQNSINANAQAQAHAQAQAQAQALMLQAQMGRGAGQTPQQGFQHMQHPMQAAQMPQQQPQQSQPQLFQQQQQIALNMANQAGRGMGPNQQAMGIAGGPNRPMFPNEMARLGPADKNKVMELATKMMAQASDQQKASTRLHLQSRLTAQQLAEFQSQGRDPLVWFYQNQAFQALKQSSMNRFQQGGPANQNNPQAAMMQQQHSQQSLQQQRQNMINAAQQPGAAHDFSQFTPNMESIKDQQMTGLMAQQAGQVVVPASNGAGRNATPQPGNQNIPNQQVQNQTPRTAQQQQQQQQQQAKLNQAAQQSQALQAQMKMQNQQQMTGGMATSQSPGMNTLNTPVSRPGGLNPMGQGGIQFGDQRFHQGIQRPNNPAFNAMLANMTPEQRQAINGLPPDKLNEVMRRWQSQRQEQMASMNGNQMMQQQMANRPQNQFNQMGPNMAAAPPMQQPTPGAGNQPQPMPMGRMAPQNGAQLQILMDSMDLPPNIVSQIGVLPVEVKKWRDLKLWISQNNTLPPNIRSQLATLQQKQFQMIMQRRAGAVPQQPGQALNMNPAMPMQMANQQALQRPMGNIPPQLLQVSPQEMMHIRSQKPGLVNVPDEQLRQMILQMKRTSWQQQQQQQQQLRAQQVQVQNHQQPAPNHMTGPQGPMQIQQPQPNLSAQTQAQAMPNAMSQTASMQASNQKQQPNANQNQARNNQPQPAKNLKRPNPDDGADTAGAKAPVPASRTAAAVAQPNQQPGQRPGQKFAPQLTPQQEASLNPEQRARYEHLLKMGQLQGKAAAAGAAPQAGNAPQNNSESLLRLKMIGQEEQKQFVQETMPDIPMGPEEYAETAGKLKRIVSDMSKVGRGLSKWYAITQDDARAKMFFRTRLRIIKQHVDGEKMETMKDVFSIRSSDLDQARAMLESMAKDLAASVIGRHMMKPGGQAQAQQPGSAQAQQQSLQQQQAQQKNQSAQPAPLNAANLEKNAQALNKMNQQKQAGKAGQVPPAPTTTQPPFPFGATSPHGNPNYMSKPKDLNLQLPPARKKQKLATGQHSGQSSQGATPSPQIAKNASPDIRRAQGPPKPVFLCTESDCDMSAVGFPSEQALQHHIDEEHTKPKEDPVKFLQENLALALGLELDGTIKKEQKPADGAQAMSLSTSKQGQASGNPAGTPMSQDGTSMKRSASAMSKGQDTKLGIKSEAAAKLGDGKQANGATIPAAMDPWANSTIDPQTLLQNLGFENGLPNIVNEANMYRSFTPKDTPESSKDGASEPNSDISEGAALDIDMNWQNMDTDLLLEYTNAALDGDMAAADAALSTLDPNLLLTRPAGVPDWDSINTDFSKPFQFDLSLYSFDA
ncbi:hypothetical protein TARUN_8685, partial [Trichoderma arundinaceum]